LGIEEVGNASTTVEMGLGVPKGKEKKDRAIKL